MILLTSGHPEFDKQIIEYILNFRLEGGLFSEDVYNEAFPRASEEHEGDKVGESIIKFILDIKA